MPEGPEIQRAADKIARVLVGEKLQEVRINWPSIEDYVDTWVGRTIVSIKAKGKALLTELDNGDVLYTHNQLYGRWLTRKTHEEPSSRRSLRIAFRTCKGGAYLYSATDLEVWSKETISDQPYVAKLGPDILDENLTTRRLKKRLTEKAFRNRQLVTLYLDQSFLAGPGNYLRSEILFCAGVHFRTKPRQLEAKQLTRLARETLKISQRAYEQQGVTVEAGLVKKLKAQGLRKRGYRHYVFGREGKDCRICRMDTIVKVRVSGRSVFFCPTCQPEL